MKTVVQWYADYCAARKSEMIDVDTLLADAERDGYVVATVGKANASKALVHAITTMDRSKDFVHGPRNNHFLFNSSEEAIVFKLTFA
jgi:hypothetical protein